MRKLLPDGSMTSMSANEIARRADLQQVLGDLHELANCVAFSPENLAAVAIPVEAAEIRKDAAAVVAWLAKFTPPLAAIEAGAGLRPDLVARSSRTADHVAAYQTRLARARGERA